MSVLRILNVINKEARIRRGYKNMLKDVVDAFRLDLLINMTV